MMALQTTLSYTVSR